MSTCDDGLAAGPAEFELLDFAFVIVLTGLEFASLDRVPILPGDLVDDL